LLERKATLHRTLPANRRIRYVRHLNDDCAPLSEMASISNRNHECRAGKGHMHAVRWKVAQEEALAAPDSYHAKHLP
jgi:hypothetical protein